MQIWWQMRQCGFWLCVALSLSSPARAQVPDSCQSPLSRGIFCTHTPNLIGEWKYFANFGNWTSGLPRDFPSSPALLSAWAQATRKALNSPTNQCNAGSIVNVTMSNTTTGRFERGTFPERLLEGTYRYELACTDTSMGYPIQRNEAAVISVGAERKVGCAPPLTERTWPATGAAMCLGESQPVVTLKDLGPEEKGSRASPRVIEATVTNGANNHALMADAIISLKVFTPTGKGQAGRLLNTTYPGQYAPASSILAITNREGKTISTFSWPQTAQQAPIQRIGANCDASGTCAATLDVRWNSDIVIGFFNGVANTDEAAQKSLDRLDAEFGAQYKDSPLKYDWFYNQTACGQTWYEQPACLEDVAEVFEQRSLELDGVFARRWETFWDILTGRHTQTTSFTGRLTQLLGESGHALLQWLDASFNAVLNQLARDTLKLLTLFTDSPTYENQASHLERLTRYANEGSRLLLVAHSQGNLFVNSAFDALKAAKPDATAQVVHVAPASPTLRGDHVLADIDLIINALRVTGLNSVPDVTIALPLSSKDVTGHGFEPTYLDKARAAYSRTIGMITTGLEALAQ